MCKQVNQYKVQNHYEAAKVKQYRTTFDQKEVA